MTAQKPAAVWRDQRDDYDVVVPGAFEHYHCVHEPRVAIRVGPQHDAPIVGSIKHGEDVKVVRKAGDWVQLEDNTETGEQRWVLVDGKYHKLGKLLVPSSDYYSRNFAQFDEIKKQYRLVMP